MCVCMCVSCLCDVDLKHVRSAKRVSDAPWSFNLLMSLYPCSQEYPQYDLILCSVGILLLFRL